MRETQVLLRGCRCIEIDVHNGDTDSKSSESTSTSTSQTLPKPEHHRHLSGTTLSHLAMEAKEIAEAKIKSARQKISGGTGNSLGLSNLKVDENGKSTDTLAVGNSISRPPSVRSVRNGEPVVLHGWTLTSSVGFRDVCKTVRETAFITSNLPIIVSLEVHANVEQQEVMVKIMKEEWAGLLVDTAHPSCNPEERLPRLDELLNKILIKVKKASSQPLERTTSKDAPAPVPSQQDGDSGVSSASDDEKSAKKKAKICESLSNLGIYTHSEHFVSFEAKSAKKPSHIFSIGESQILELYEKKKERVFAHNRDYFMRAYPAGYRFDSSNLDPSTFWRKGVQMVALNWQYIDEAVMLNEGMFAGEQGWALKPPGYRSDPTEPIPYEKLQLRIIIYGGQNIPIPPEQTQKAFNPQIRCELHVEKPEEKKKIEVIEGAIKGKSGEWKHKTQPLKGDHPDLGPDGFALDFPSVEGVLEELSFVRYVIS
jgi:phosphatidylinositol phospholipase C delta